MTDPYSGSPVTPPVQRPDTTWPMLCHLSALVALIGVPFGQILGPLIVWLIKKDQNPEVDQHGKEALNFQISMTIYGLVAGVLMLVLVGFVLLIAVIVVDIVLTIIAAVRASNGEFYRYPFTIRFIN
jgi:uncharacterized protein